MTSLDDDRWKKAVDLIRQRIPGVVAIYLFGSAVGECVHDRSDIDLAVLARQPVSSTTRWEIQQELAVTLRSDIDLVDLSSASTVMRFQVVSTGSVLYDGNSTERAEFEMTTLSMYTRFNLERREILEQVSREGSVYGG